jgi:hypothetical protein
MSAAEIVMAEQRPQSSRARVAQEYDAYLADFAPGEVGRAELTAGEMRLRVRSRLQAAAKRRGLALRFRPGPHKALIFHVEVALPPKARPVPLPTAPSAQLPDGAASQRELTRRPSRRRETPTERYHKVLPRWMREGDQGGRRNGSKRRAR